MKIRQIVPLLCLGMTASFSYGAEAKSAALLAPMDNVSQSNIFYGSATASANLPGGNAFEGSSQTSEISAIPNAGVPDGPAVPEPSITGLVCLGLLGLISLQMRRRHYAR